MTRKTITLVATLTAGALAVTALRSALKGPQGHFVAPKRGPIVEAVYGIGTVTANRLFQLKVGITTGIQKRFVEEGAQVKQGEPLVLLDETGLQRAPFPGTVTNIYYNERETVFPQTPILKLVDLTKLYVLVSLEQQGAMRIRPGQTAHLSFESIRGTKFDGKVESLFPNDGQFLVHISVPNLPEGILPGMTSDVAIEVSKKDEATLIPLAAISSGVVLAVKDGKKSKLSLQVGNIDGEWAEVLSPAFTSNDQIWVPEK